MHYPIGDIDSISQKLRRQFTSVGIKTTEHLLQRAPADRRAALARSIGAPEDEVLRAIRIADLMRVDGVGPNYAALLLAAGIQSPPVLAEAKEAVLHGVLRPLKPRVPGLKRLPHAGQVGEWIRDAARLPPIVT